MAYQALYRAWRPDGFSTIVGQEPITTTLVNQIKKGQIAHAYLFTGSRGTGKTSTAKVFARAINCLSPLENGDPCGACDVCRSIASDTSMDVIEIDAASNNGVDEIRELRDKIKYPPTIGKYKVYIVDEVHMLSTGAFNALLKTLEEPPEHAVFILATTEPQKLPATILSRCQRYDFKRIPAQAIIGKLRLELESIGRTADDDALMDIARAAEGGMRDAESLMDMCLAYGDGQLTSPLVRNILGTSDRRALFEFAGALIDERPRDALLIIDQQMQSGRDAQVFAREIAGHMRALIMAQLMPSDIQSLLDLTAEDAQRYVEQAKSAPEQMLTRAMDMFIQAEGGLRWASQPRSVLELCAVRCCHPERESSIEALIERVGKLEKLLLDGAVRVQPPETAQAAPEGVAPEPTAPSPSKPAPASAPKPAVVDAPSSARPEKWDELIDMLKGDMGMMAPLRMIHSAQLDGDVLIIAFTKDKNMFANMFKSEDRKRALEGYLNKLYGRPIALQIVEAGAQNPRPLAKMNVLEEVYDVFGRDNVTLVDDF